MNKLDMIKFKVNNAHIYKGYPQQTWLDLKVCLDAIQERDNRIAELTEQIMKMKQSENHIITLNKH